MKYQFKWTLCLVWLAIAVIGFICTSLSLIQKTPKMFYCFCAMLILGFLFMLIIFFIKKEKSFKCAIEKSLFIGAVYITVLTTIIVFCTKFFYDASLFKSFSIIIALISFWLSIIFCLLIPRKNIIKVKVLKKFLSLVFCVISLIFFLSNVLSFDDIRLSNKYNNFIKTSDKVERFYNIYDVKDFKLINTIYLHEDKEGIANVKYKMYHNYNLSYLYDCTIETKDIEGNDISIETSNYLFEHHDIHFDEDISSDEDYISMIEVYEAKMPVKLGFLTLYEDVLYYNIKAKKHKFVNED